MQGVFIVSPNGLGHFKRTLGWLPSLFDAFPSLTAHVLACQWQVERLGGEWLTSPRIHFHTGFVDAAVRWSRQAEDYHGADLLGWTQTLESWPLLASADFVVSDNLVEVLRLRSDAIMMGSFLWGDILNGAYPGIASIERYREKEVRLLQAHQPPMLCVGDMAMPAVREQTQAVLCPWFTERLAISAAQQLKPQVAFLGGATPSIQSELLTQARQLSTAVDWEIWVPDRMVQPEDPFQPFDFSPTRWRTLDAVVCRPGIGTLSDAISHGVPVLALEEPENPEMWHNAQQVKALGMGEALSLDALNQLPEVLTKLLEPSAFKGYQEVLQSRPVGGHLMATEWLKAWLG